jgi:hypothetical protein
MGKHGVLHAVQKPLYSDISQLIVVGQNRIEGGGWYEKGTMLWGLFKRPLSGVSFCDNVSCATIRGSGASEYLQAS